ncbi:MAG: metalloregulator ArsR/SmtB family transcription factor [Chloroflexota bacterium]
MSKMERESSSVANLDARAQLFKALGHPTRLLILNLIDMKPRHGEELAAILKMPPASVSHHLTKLTNAGLLETEKEQYYQVYKLVEGILSKSLGEVVRLEQAGLGNDVEEDAYRQKVLKAFFKHGRLVNIPAQLKKRQIVIEALVEEFELEEEYTEREVNHILVDFHDDVAYLRREFISQGLMKREKGIYKRV